jgi:hypothetical protein
MQVDVKDAASASKKGKAAAKEVPIEETEEVRSV